MAAIDSHGEVAPSSKIGLLRDLSRDWQSWSRGERILAACLLILPVLSSFFFLIENLPG